MKPQIEDEQSVSEIATIALRLPADMETLPIVTVIVPCRNEEKHIGRCLESILANDYPKERLEILVLEGMSEDRTREIVAGYSARHPIIRQVDNPQKHIPAAMNLGIQNARGATIIKMDAHSTFQRNHISLCVAYQEEYGAENVGGVCKMMPGANTAMARAIVLGLGSRFGSGNANVKVGVEKPTWSDTAAFGCFKKELFSRLGLFDERLLSSSDLDMNLRIRARGRRGFGRAGCGNQLCGRCESESISTPRVCRRSVDQLRHEIWEASMVLEALDSGGICAEPVGGVRTGRSQSHISVDGTGHRTGVPGGECRSVLANSGS